MSIKMLRCLRCGRLSSPGTIYCPFCGEAVDPALVAELQWLYGALNDLDTRITRGEGDHTITALRDEYRTRYLAVRKAPASAAAERSPATATAVPLWPAVPSAAATTPASSTQNAPVEPTTPVAAPVAAPARPAMPAAPAIPAEPRPVFSWQAFLSEQAIAIMMYMGGFLGLVAMLSFEIGGWQSLDLSVKLGAIILVYIAFGILGLVMRRLPRLRTVGGAYLGVFALMTPLLALGIYRFGLQAAGFSGAAMLSLSSAYAAIVYLALAWRTRFATYAYLGWSALILSLLAVVYWVDAPREALIFALAVASIALLLPGIFHRLAIAALLETSATQLAAVTAIAAAAGTLFLWLTLSVRAIADTPFALTTMAPPHLSSGVYALSAATLALVAVGWSHVARRLTASLEPAIRATQLNVLDWLILAAATQAAIAIAAWAGADRRAMAIVLSALALAEVGVLFMLWRRARERAELRYLVEALALALAIGGCIGATGDSAPNWPLLLALTTGVAVTGGLALFEAAPWWLVAAGAFLSLDYHVLLDAIFHQTLTASPPAYQMTFWAIATTGLILALALPCVVAPPSSRLSRYILPVYAVALANALYVTVNLFSHDPFYATLILGVFVALALAAGWRARNMLAGGLIAGFFGLLLPFPFSIAGGDPAFVMDAAIAGLVVGIAALGVRWLLGRASALPVYLIALWTALVVSLRVLAQQGAFAGWSFLSVSAVSWLLLAFALLATIAILWDNVPWALFIPATFGLAAALATSGLSGVALTVALVAAGMLLRQLRGRWWWSIAWYIAAFLASLGQIAVFIVESVVLHQADPYRPVYVALLFALVAYIAGAIERQPWLTAVAPLYVLLAAATTTGDNSFAITVAITFGMVIVGLALRVSVGSRWALAAYLSAILPSLITVIHATPRSSGVIEALLLVFAVTAYGIALVERASVAGIIAAFYAGLAALVQPDAHALLPLALTLVALGIVIGRAGGWRWSWPVYASGFVAAMLTAYLGRHDGEFEVWALLALTVAFYLVAAIEAQADVLILAMALGVFSLAAGIHVLDLPLWLGMLAFVALAWVYTLGQWLWSALPWVRADSGHAWWVAGAAPESGLERWRDMRYVGRFIHHAAGLLVGSGVVITALLVTETWLPQTGMAQVQVVALLSLAAQVALSARTIPAHALWYVSGGLLAIAVSWQVRWFGADNIQAFVLAPGSYLLIIGALLPADARLRHPARAGQIASLVGALLLLLPTLAQSFTTAFSENWIYASVLALEALAIAAVGVGTHTRALILLGTGFFGLAAIRGALLAFSSGVPVALIIAALALVLMGSATWLSLRVRQDASVPHTS